MVIEFLAINTVDSCLISGLERWKVDVILIDKHKKHDKL